MADDFKPGAPSWVDLGTTDVAGATAFYCRLFGWTIEDLGPAAGGYAFFRLGGKQVAGVGPVADPARGTSWSVYFATSDVDDTAAKVDANGGSVIMAPTDVMDQGRMAVFTDPTGASFCAWQPGRHRGAELVHAHGSMSWVELYTSDIAAARAFYPAVFPVGARDIDLGGGQTYLVLSVDDTDVAGAMQVGPETGSPRWALYFAVDDCDTTADLAIELGATELLRQDSPAGRFAVLSDPQGGSFSIIRPNPDFSV